MRPYSGRTDRLHLNRIPAEVRAYFSLEAARLEEEVWLRVETRWVSDGTPLQVAIYRDGGESGDELVKDTKGTLSKGLWEEQWRVELPKERLDELHGPIEFYFDAKLEGHPGTARSQTLLLHRTRFSS
jgi:hypothetical protein